MTKSMMKLMTNEAVVGAVARSLPKLARGGKHLGKAGNAVAAVASVAGGGVAMLKVVSASGAVAGTSAAGLSSGLAAVGSAVGGGMAAGLGVVAAVPAACGGAAILALKVLAK